MQSMIRHYHKFYLCLSTTFGRGSSLIAPTEGCSDRIIDESYPESATLVVAPTQQQLTRSILIKPYNYLFQN